MAITTEILKKELTAKGYSNIKRVSKKKDDHKNVIREFSTDQGTVFVKTNSSDDQILSIEQTQASTSNSSLLPLKELTLKNFKQSLEEADLEIEFNPTGLSKIFGIPSVSDYPGDDFFEEFLLVYSNGSKIIVDGHYSESLKSESGVVAKKDLVGVYVSSDFEFSYPSSHIQMNIPKGTLVYWKSPEYHKLIFISPDFKSGITTSKFSEESDVSGTNADLIAIGMYDLSESPTMDDSAVKKAKKYAFVNFHM